MNSKNTYLDKILTLPSKKIINQWFRTIFLFTIIFIPIIFFKDLYCVFCNTINIF